MAFGLEHKIDRLHGLLLLALKVENWVPVWAARRELPGPGLRFRNGATLRGGPGDNPLQCFFTVFRDRYYRRYVSEPDEGVYIDIGANIGLVSLDWAFRLPRISVHAYEPDPRTFATLRENVMSNRMHDRVLIYNEAVAREKASAEFTRGNGSLSTSAFPDLFSAGHGRTNEKFVASTVGLGEVITRCGNNSSISLVKINAEGREADILQGSSPMLLARVSQF